MSTNDRLRAAAHPLRARLLRELDLGPATATELAARLATNSGTTSYHLRRLEAAGLVEDTGDAPGRRRAWARTPEPLLDAPVDDPGDEASLDWLERDYLAHLTDKAAGWLDEAADWPAGWRDVAGQRDYLVHVTEQQLATLNAEIAEVAARYRAAGAGDPRARRVSVYQVNVPIDAPPNRSQRRP